MGCGNYPAKVGACSPTRWVAVNSGGYVTAASSVLDAVKEMFGVDLMAGIGKKPYEMDAKYAAIAVMQRVLGMRVARIADVFGEHKSVTNRSAKRIQYRMDKGILRSDEKGAHYRAWKKQVLEVADLMGRPNVVCSAHLGAFLIANTLNDKDSWTLGRARK